MTLEDIRNLFVEIVCFEMKSANSEVATCKFNADFPPEERGWVPAIVRIDTWGVGKGI